MSEAGALASFSDDELIEELARRRNSRAIIRAGAAATIRALAEGDKQ